MHPATIIWVFLSPAYMNHYSHIFSMGYYVLLLVSTSSIIYSFELCTWFYVGVTCSASYLLHPFTLTYHVPYLIVPDLIASQYIVVIIHNSGISSVWVCVSVHQSLYLCPNYEVVGFQPQGGNIPKPRLCASPQYIFTPPYAKYACQRWYKQRTDNRYTYGHIYGQRGCPN